MPERSAIVEITPELLIQALYLPKDTEIEGIELSMDKRSVYFKLSHIDLIEVADGCTFPKALPTYGKGKKIISQEIVFLGWGQ